VRKPNPNAVHKHHRAALFLRRHKQTNKKQNGRRGTEEKQNERRVTDERKCVSATE
jgi:hypothetical protein